MSDVEKYSCRRVEITDFDDFDKNNSIFSTSEYLSELENTHPEYGIKVQTLIYDNKNMKRTKWRSKLGLY